MTSTHGTLAISSPLVLQSGHSRMVFSSIGIAHTPRWVLERINVTLPPRVGEAYPPYPAYPAVPSATKWPGFNLAEGLIALSAHLPHGINGDTTLADKRPTLGRQQPAEPKESSKEPTYRAYRALFSHFPRIPALREALAASGAQRNAEKSPLRGISSLSSHFLAISREAGRPQQRQQVRGTQENPPLRGLSALVRTF
jgi:hypothetical protein